MFPNLEFCLANVLSTKGSSLTGCFVGARRVRFNQRCLFSIEWDLNPEMSTITTSITLLITINEDGLKRNIFTTGTAQAVEERNVSTWDILQLLRSDAGSRSYTPNRCCSFPIPGLTANDRLNTRPLRYQLTVCQLPLSDT